MTATVADLLTRREQIRRELNVNQRHLLNVLRDPEPELRSVPIGDALCWCEGIDEATATTILTAAKIKWGLRLFLLSARDIAAVCWEIKTRHPETWERWKMATREPRRVAA